MKNTNLIRENMGLYKDKKIGSSHHEVSIITFNLNMVLLKIKFMIFSLHYFRILENITYYCERDFKYSRVFTTLRILYKQHNNTTLTKMYCIE